MTEDSSLISRAIVVWTGKGNNAWPPPHDSLLVEAFGVDEAARLLPIVQELKEKFFTSSAKWTVAGNKEMADVAVEEFRLHHPELTDEAVEGLANWYAWSYR